MSRFKNMSRAGYIVIGFTIALSVVPTAAAATSIYDGIVGTSGHEANVTGAGQLLTTEASPATTWTHSSEYASPGDTEVYFDVPPNEFPVLTGVQVDTSRDPSPGQGSAITLYDSSCGTCTAKVIAAVNPPTIGNTTIPFSPGLSTTRNGRYFSGPQEIGLFLSLSGPLQVTITLNGYYAPCNDDPAACPS